MRDWQGEVLDLVRCEGADKRSQARLLSWGVNGAGAVVMVAVFAQTGGLTGGEIAVAGGTTARGPAAAGGGVRRRRRPRRWPRGPGRTCEARADALLALRAGRASTSWSTPPPRPRAPPTSCGPPSARWPPRGGGPREAAA